jgi:hypothetical protein
MSRALDIVTVLHALRQLEKRLGVKGWKTEEGGVDQTKVFSWLKKFGKTLDKISGIEGLVSGKHDELNQFLLERKFGASFAPFKSKFDLGAVSVIDKKVKWLHGPAKETTIKAGKNGQQLSGFKLPAGGVNVYKVEGYKKSYLLELLTKSDDTLWLFVHPDLNIEWLDLVELSFDVMSKSRIVAGFNTDPDILSRPSFSGAIIPMIDLLADPDVSFLLDAVAVTNNEDCYRIGQACQQFKIRMDQNGARVKAATSVGMVYMSCIAETQPYIVDEPFYGWWTQKGVDLPMGAFFADFDSMKRPAGSLEDL